MSRPCIDGTEPLVQTKLTIPRDLKRRAKAAGLNISALARLAIEDALGEPKGENWSARAKRIRALRNVVLSMGAYHEGAVERHRRALKEGRAPKWEVDVIEASHDIEPDIARAAATQLEEEMAACRRLLATSRSATFVPSSGGPTERVARATSRRRSGTPANSTPSGTTVRSISVRAGSVAAVVPASGVSTLSRRRVGSAKRTDRKREVSSEPSESRRRRARRKDVGR